MRTTLRTERDYRRAIEDITAEGCKFHHTGSRRGYISRRKSGEIEPYEGNFGKGYIIARPRWDTSQYVYVDYYIKED